MTTRRVCESCRRPFHQAATGRTARFCSTACRVAAHRRRAAERPGRRLRVLVGCEHTGAVRDAFAALGHDAWSCDLLPDESPAGGNHYQGDVRDMMGQSWDLAVMHPPCTYLTNSGVTWLHRDTDRWRSMIEGAAFFRWCLELPVPRVAVENPVMHGYAREIVGSRPTQVVQPYMFGHREQKATGLWLRGLPKLVPTDDVKAETMELPPAVRQRLHYVPPGPERWKVRSATFPGLAAAMADQWAGRCDDASPLPVDQGDGMGEQLTIC